MSKNGRPLDVQGFHPRAELGVCSTFLSVDAWVYRLPVVLLHKQSRAALS
jgi:hypothetical protein